MVTLISRVAAKDLPPAIATTRTSEVSPIFTFSFTNGAAPSLKSNLPVSGKGFFSISTAIEVVPGMLLEISIGTTAPFSAICGASITMSLLGAGFALPRPFRASAALFAPKASWFHAAAAASGLRSSRPSAARTVLRMLFMDAILACAAAIPPIGLRVFPRGGSR